MIRYRKRPDGLYECTESYRFLSSRYNKWVYIHEGQIRDGATGAFDIKSSSWWVHDQLCADGHWHDGTICTPWQAATTLGDILRDEGRWFRAITWKYTTYLFGCKNTRKNKGA